MSLSHVRRGRSQAVSTVRALDRRTLCLTRLVRVEVAMLLAIYGSRHSLIPNRCTAGTPNAQWNKRPQALVCVLSEVVFKSGPRNN